jgi:hypothetical protein
VLECPFFHKIGNLVQRMRSKTVSFEMERTSVCAQNIRALPEDNLMGPIHLQAVRQNAQHNGQDAGSPPAAQVSGAAEEAFPIQMQEPHWHSTAVKVRSGMTVLELKELFQVCSYACDAAERICM